ncbi:Internalin-A precursor [Gemmata obscuriglobus]|nr:TIGR02996 domain-containing protein [Gemmata obscuriglobus]QEG31909.1 Internalin-A precursor [Gemmata obscuriglobus]VTS11255.1 Uncharacterized protein OS=Citrus sinensis GN=CISIN_1g009672mg PE=4 SV=1 [Gemmata obscuriglobus UQM 2246]
MSEEDALLAAIHANPDDDDPRLAYADWLDEHDRPERAEFIRAQVEWSRLRSDEAGRLKNRTDELLATNFQRWTAEIGPLDPEKVQLRFERGFPTELTIRDATEEELSILRQLPTIRLLALEGQCELTPSVLALIIALGHLDVLLITEAEINVTVLNALESLPPWVFLRLCTRTCGNEAWLAFRARRLARFEQLPPDEQRGGAIRALRFSSYHLPRPCELVKSLDVSPTDDELRVFTSIREVEHVRIANGDVTTAGLYHLPRLSKLKTLEIDSCPVDSIAPLTACPNLTELVITAEAGTERRAVVNDTGTAGLEKLTNLRRLKLDWCEIGGQTLRRLAALHRLRSLELMLFWGQHISGTDLAELTGLLELEKLTLHPIPPWALEYIGPLRTLRTLTLSLFGEGDSEFRHLAQLTNLCWLKLTGPAVTDCALGHLRTLRSLRTLHISESAVTATGALTLAHQLPAAKIISDTVVAWSPNTALTFHRRVVAGFASVLVPVGWDKPQEHSDPFGFELQEDGWDPADATRTTGTTPARIALEVCAATSAEDGLRSWLQRDGDYTFDVITRRPTVLAGPDSAVCEYSDRLLPRERQIAFAIADSGSMAVLVCTALEYRMEELRPLFMFIARSLRVGAAALE